MSDDKPRLKLGKLVVRNVIVNNPLKMTWESDKNYAIGHIKNNQLGNLMDAMHPKCTSCGFLEVSSKSSKAIDYGDDTTAIVSSASCRAHPPTPCPDQLEVAGWPPLVFPMLEAYESEKERKLEKLEKPKRKNFETW